MRLQHIPTTQESRTFVNEPSRQSFGLRRGRRFHFLHEELREQSVQSRAAVQELLQVAHHWLVIRIICIPIAVLLLLFAPGEPGSNAYGINPKTPVTQPPPLKA